MDQAERDLEEIIRKVLDGDPDAAKVLLSHQSKWLMAKAKSLLRDRPYLGLSEQDIVQETWRRVLASLSRFKPQTPLVAKFCYWVGTILRNYVSNVAARKQAALQKLERDAFTEPSDETPTPSRQVAMAQAFTFLSKCVLELDERTRTIIRLYYEEDLSVTAVAKKMDLTEEAVGGVLKRSRSKLKNMMGRSSNYYLPEKK